MPPLRVQTRITALMPADGWRLVGVEVDHDGAYVGVGVEPITAWVAVEDLVERLAYVTHMPLCNPRDGWVPKENDFAWWEIGLSRSRTPSPCPA